LTPLDRWFRLQLFFPSWTHKPGFLTSILFSTLNKDLRKPIWETAKASVDYFRLAVREQLLYLQGLAD
jgi:hypothetical protein